MDSFKELQLQFEFGIKRRLYNWHMRRQRLNLGLTQRELGQKVGCAVCTISAIECFRKYPPQDLQHKLVRILGLSAEVLFPEWLSLFQLDAVPSVTEEGHISLQAAQEIGLLDAPHLLAEGPEEQVFKWDLRDAIDQALESLNPKERKVIRLRYGLGDNEEMTMGEVAREFKVTRGRIFQIEHKALRKLRHPCRSRKLKEYLD